jgi:two-component system response regulator RegA
MNDRSHDHGNHDHVRPSLLICDDDAVFRERLARSFTSRGYDVRTAGNCDEARQLARQDSPEMAVVDLRMPGGSGLELVRDLKEIDPATRVVMLTGYGSIATAVDAVKLGAVNYLPKPADVDDILLAFRRGEAPVDPSDSVDYTVPSLARAEWEHIQRVLADSGGNISEASRRLGIHRRSLQRKLAKYAPR